MSVRPDRIYKTYTCIGYDAYFDKIMPKLMKLCNKIFRDPDQHFLIAVNEAVCNAAKYAIAGDDKVEITVDYFITETDISLSVHSDTRPFAVERFQEQLQRLANDRRFGFMDWDIYTGESDRSRGYWLMLMAVDYLYTNVDGKTVTLVAKYPYQKFYHTKQIRHLVPRFLIEKGGVLY